MFALRITVFNCYANSETTPLRASNETSTKSWFSPAFSFFIFPLGFENMTTSKKPITIKIAAKKVGIGIETIRYYQRIGLVDEPGKPLSGYRVYPEETLVRLFFIKCAKKLGFSLAEIVTLLALSDGKCSETRKIAEQKLELIKSKIHDLQAITQTLETLLLSCDANLNPQDCPIITAISNKMT